MIETKRKFFRKICPPADPWEQFDIDSSLRGRVKYSVLIVHSGFELRP